MYARRLRPLWKYFTTFKTTTATPTSLKCLHKTAHRELLTAREKLSCWLLKTFRPTSLKLRCARKERRSNLHLKVKVKNTALLSHLWVFFGHMATVYFCIDQPALDGWCVQYWAGHFYFEEHFLLLLAGCVHLRTRVRQNKSDLCGDANTWPPGRQVNVLLTQLLCPRNYTSAVPKLSLVCSFTIQYSLAPRKTVSLRSFKYSMKMTYGEHMRYVSFYLHDTSIKASSRSSLAWFFFSSHI